MSRVLIEPQTVTGELIDALIEAVVVPPDPAARSAVICNLVQEISTAVEWQHDGAPLDDAACDELASIRQVAAAAQDHQLRMSSRDAGAGKNSS